MVEIVDCSRSYDELAALSGVGAQEGLSYIELAARVAALENK